MCNFTILPHACPDIVVLALEKGLVCKALPNYPANYSNRLSSIILNIDGNIIRFQ